MSFILFLKISFRTDSIFYTSSDCIRILGLLFKSDRWNEWSSGFVGYVYKKGRL